MPKKLNITILQQPLIWEDPKANLLHFTKLINNIKAGSTDVIVLPEMFTTGFTMKATHLAETTGGLAMTWMAEAAQAKRAAICGSVMMKEKKNIFNQFIWMAPDLSFTSYNKRHLFRMGGEDKVFAAGQESVLIEYKGWNICPQVCYDLRFPVWSRNRMLPGKKEYTPEYDALIYAANWPETRSFAWKQLLVARAIENQCYVIGVNMVGSDGNNLKYSGDSVVLDYMGKKISKSNSKKAFVETIALDPAPLKKFRKAFPVLMDADAFSMK